jgi:hypothetical protein
VSSCSPPERWPPSTPDGRFGEPDPDDADTGPLHISTPPPSNDDSRRDGGETNSLPREDSWEMPACTPRVTARGRARSNVAAKAVLILVIFKVMHSWLVRQAASPHAGDDH